jgi:uncharacterized membrane protein (DUF2068 family)
VSDQRRERGLTLIIAYKLVKGGFWLLMDPLLLGLGRTGLASRLSGFAEHLRHHAGAWSLELADLIARAASLGGLWVIVIALAGDGIVSLIEGWALLGGRPWAAWLVVFTTGSLLPFEVVALVRRTNAVRVAVLSANLAIVVYLARKALRERRESENPPELAQASGRASPTRAIRGSHDPGDP